MALYCVGRHDPRTMDAKAFGIHWYEVGGARCDLADEMCVHVVEPDIEPDGDDYFDALNAFDRLDGET